MTRETLPNRRGTIGYAYDHEGQSYMAHVSHYDDGRPAELFVTGAKVGTGVDNAARAASIATSFCLQYGVPLDKLRAALPRDPQGKPLDPVGAALDLLDFA